MTHDEPRALSSIQTAVKQGQAVVTAKSGAVLAMMQAALRSGTSTTFYVAPDQAQAFMRWYWTPKRAKEIGLEVVSEEERAKIESELGIKDMGPWYSNRITCPNCGSVYGGFEFMEQGIEQHGKDWVGAITQLEGVSVVRINPAQDAICRRCGIIIIISAHYYAMYAPDGTLIYACTSGEIDIYF